MSTSTSTESQRQSFAEAALRLGGKTDEEVRRTGAVDRAGEWSGSSDPSSCARARSSHIRPNG